MEGGEAPGDRPNPLPTNTIAVWQEPLPRPRRNPAIEARGGGVVLMRREQRAQSRPP